MTQPNQPLYKDEHGVIRFRPNKLVRYLLENGKLNLNDLAIAAHTHGIAAEDQAQFAQLIGYSLCGFGDLSYVTNRKWAAAARQKVCDK